ncbi:hypothetical protein [Methylobacterium sp. J-090]|uniref:hypothetical protein n=1 Tax=Methylobacterium sp. J-090 TaxID=2836666 RepID=UPI001FB922B2|nr:hypothetical protein [Methylobacterium sp. J-090]MCJ2082488.1 hypothetical protein [Methylobacterium sp. J-090]
MTTIDTIERASDAGPNAGGRSMPPPFIPPRISDASRRIVVPRKGSLRGALVTRGEVPRIVTYESDIERRVLLVLLARPDVVEVTEQVEPVRFLDEDGLPRKHYFDFKAVRRNGDRGLIAVKKLEWIERHPEFEDQLRLIAAQVPRSVADRVILMTDADASRSAVHDAKLIHSVRADGATDYDASVRDIVSTLIGTTTVGCLVAASGLEGRGFRAVVRLIDDGTLRVVDHSRIGYETRVALVSNLEVQS